MFHANHLIRGSFQEERSERDAINLLICTVPWVMLVTAYFSSSETKEERRARKVMLHYSSSSSSFSCSPPLPLFIHSLSSSSPLSDWLQAALIRMLQYIFFFFSKDAFDFCRIQLGLQTLPGFFGDLQVNLSHCIFHDGWNKSKSRRLSRREEEQTKGIITLLSLSSFFCFFFVSSLRLPEFQDSSTSIRRF